MTESSPFKNDLETLLEEAMGFEPGQRRAFLEARLGDDPGILKEALALLKVVEKSDGFLETPLITFMAEATQSATETLEGDLEALKDFRIIECLGEGGMGKVYRAEQIEPVQRTVALKVMKIHPLDRRRAANFQYESRVLGQMEHPNVARLYQAGTTQSGFPFFTMELVHGLSLRQYLKNHRPTQRQRLEHFLEICAGVEHAHQKGIIHRDIKPSNVLVSHPDDQPTIKLIDFGVARALDLDSTALVNEEATEKRVLGTLAYMSPEQIRGEPDDVRVDVYGLGAILYEMWTGVAAFSPTASGTTSKSSMVTQVLESSPIPPSEILAAGGGDPDMIAARNMGHTYQQDLDAIVGKAMAKDREKRYGNVAQMAGEVRALLEKRPVAARGTSPLYLFGRWLRRHRIQAIVWAAVFLAVGAGVAGALWGLVQARAAEDLAEQKRLQAEQSRNDLDMAMSYIESVILATHPGRNPMDAPLINILNEAYEESDASLPDNPEIRARVFNILAEAYMARSKFEKAEVLFNNAYRNCVKSYEPGDPKTLSALIGLGWARTELDRTELARSDFEMVMDSACPATFYWLRAKMGLADIYRLSGDFDAAVEDYQTVLSGYLDLPDLSMENRHVAMKALSLALAASGKAGLAENILETVWAEQALTAGAFSLDAMITHSELGGVVMVQGRIDEAIRMLKPTKDALVDRLGLDHEHTLDVVQNLMLCALRREELDMAERYGKTLMEGRRETLGAFHQETLTARMYLGVISGRKGDMVQSIAQMRNVYEDQYKHLGPGHRDTLNTANNLGNRLKGTRRYKEAEALLQETLETQTRKYGPSHPDTLITKCTLGETLFAQGRFEESLLLFRTLIQKAENQPETGFYRNYYRWFYGLSLAKLKRFGEAEPFLLKAFENLGRNGTYRDELADFYRAWGKPEKAVEFEE